MSFWLTAEASEKDEPEIGSDSAASQLCECAEII